MAELSRAPTASRSALLDLRDEQRLVNDGYEFLDEKRVLLAAEMLRQRETWRRLQRRFREHFDAAAAALIEAAADQGLDGLQVSPPAELADAHIETTAEPCVGQELLEATLVHGDATTLFRAIRPTPVLRACRAAFIELLASAAALAASTATLERLMHEYRRTERRVRALENIVLPEIRADISIMEEHLDLLDQEEVIRVRMLKPRDDRTGAGT